MENKQIAGELGIAEKTVKVHRAQVMAKMRAGAVAELVRLADLAGVSVAGPEFPRFPGSIAERWSIENVSSVPRAAEVAEAARRLIRSVTTNAPPRNREEEAHKAKRRVRTRFG